MTKQLKVDMPGSYKLVFGGDTHAFVEGFAWDHAKKYIQYIKKDKNTFWTCHGDVIDYMSPQDKRFKFRMGISQGTDTRTLPLADRASDQLDQFLSFFSPIGDKCVEVGLGNHEDRIINIMNPAKIISEKWNCQWGTPMTVLTLPQFKAFLWHPFHFVINMQAGDPQQRYTNECMRIRRGMRYKPGSADCEVSIMNHIHKIRISPPICRSQLLLSAEGGKFKSFHPEMTKVKDPKTGKQYYPEEYRWFASTGAMYGYYVDNDYTYAETRNYDPTDLGWIEAEVKNDKFVTLRECEV